MENEILDSPHISSELSKYFTNRGLFIWVAIVAFGILMELLRWPGATLPILSGAAGLLAYAYNGWHWKFLRNNLNAAFCILGFVWLAILIGGILFNGGYPYNVFGLLMYLFSAVFFFTIYFIRTKIGLRKTQSRGND